MRVMTLLGTRPEIVRLSRIVRLLQGYCDHVLINTGQCYDYNMSGIFFHELGYEPGPKYDLGATGSVSAQLAAIFSGLEKVIESEKPDRLLVLGDTNSSLGAIVAKRMGIPVFHLEAGNRCFDDRSPEEVNRKIIDHCADVHLCYTEHSRRNLIAEGILLHRIYVVGNPIREVIEHYCPYMKSLYPEAERVERMRHPYFLATFHRQENVDKLSRLQAIMESLVELSIQYPKHRIIVSTHPRTAKKISDSGMVDEWINSQGEPRIELRQPMGFREFISLERSADCILSDSGTVSEEACIVGRPCVILRDSTERPETIETGANILSGLDSDSVCRAVALAKSQVESPPTPMDYRDMHVSRTVANIVLGHYF